MNEQDLTTPITEPVVHSLGQEDPDVKKRVEILRITPPDMDPIVYWHQVAQDAIKSSERARKNAFQAVEERERAERELRYFTEKLVNASADERAKVPFDVSHLIDMARSGDIDLGITVNIWKKS